MNNTDQDYRISQLTEVNFTVMNTDGVVGALLSTEQDDSNIFTMPVFVPAHQKAVLHVFHIAGFLIHLLLVFALISFMFFTFTGRSGVE